MKLTREQINELTKVAEWVKHTAIGYVYIDSAGKIQTNYPDPNTHLLDFTNFRSGGGAVVDPGNPGTGQSDEDNYYAGSLANGEITDRDLLWQGPSDPDKATTATLVKDPGSKFNMIGEGVMVTAHLRKTIMTNGTKGAVSTIPMLYDPTNTARAGYYVTTSSYPAYVLASHFVVGKKLNVPFNGIGEHVNGKNVKAPMLHLTFNEDKTLTIETETGVDNDGNSAGATGANYDIIVDSISTYSTQTAVSQLPTTINLFAGMGNGQLVLSGSTDYFENVMDGIEITFDQYITETNSFRATRSVLGLPDSIRIPKDMLINGFKYSISDKYDLNKNIGNKIRVSHNQSSGGWDSLDSAPIKYIYDPGNIYIEIDKGSINAVSNIKISLYGPDPKTTQTTESFNLNIDKITPYRI